MKWLIAFPVVDGDVFFVDEADPLKPLQLSIVRATVTATPEYDDNKETSWHFRGFTLVTEWNGGLDRCFVSDAAFEGSNPAWTFRTVELDCDRAVLLSIVTPRIGEQVHGLYHQGKRLRVSFRDYYGLVTHIKPQGV